MPEYKQGDIVLAWVRDPEGTCVATCEWKVAINYEGIKERLGFTPPDLWDQIVAEILSSAGDEETRSVNDDQREIEQNVVAGKPVAW